MKPSEEIDFQLLRPTGPKTLLHMRTRPTELSSSQSPSILSHRRGSQNSELTTNSPLKEKAHGAPLEFK